MTDRRFFLAGGAGFIGSHFTDRLLADRETEAVTIYDNFSSGRQWHYAHHQGDARLRVIHGDVKDLAALERNMAGHDVAIHLASNPDIARAATEPDIDFREGTYLTQQIVEAMRRTETPRLLYASGSGVYGDLGQHEAEEDYGPLIPVSTYGASKLAGEVLIASYCAMFGLKACAFRFGNVVGPRQTHGVGFDFIRRLRVQPDRLRILGDGTQSKSYIFVEDVIEAVLLAHHQTPTNFEVYNVATGDYITVTEIARLAIQVAGLPDDQVQLEYTGGDRGWRGDVPIVRLNTSRIRSLGWTCHRTSRQALCVAMHSMLEDVRAGKL
ncbi:MAG TPA: NAD-dependent epimerase/dehydratase family protein [Bryobacteraceae bacterium]|nr:NAD-dependent epimerase/dehydratase family protein [Bryobacteraceae bacterium]